MKHLGDQWIEIIDGQEHMVKVGLSMKGEACRGCIYMGRVDECLHPCGCPMQNQFDPTTIIKDLGILNASGFLPIPFDVPDGYPKYPVINEYSRNIDGIPELFQVSYSHMNCHINFGIYNTEQQAKDAWNRRA